MDQIDVGHFVFVLCLQARCIYNKAGLIQNRLFVDLGSASYELQRDSRRRGRGWGRVFVGKGVGGGSGGGREPESF